MIVVGKVEDQGWDRARIARDHNDFGPVGAIGEMVEDFLMAVGRHPLKGIGLECDNARAEYGFAAARYGGVEKAGGNVSSRQSAERTKLLR